MTKRVETRDIHKSAAEYALKKVLEKDQKDSYENDEKRLKAAISSFFDFYDGYCKK